MPALFPQIWSFKESLLSHVRHQQVTRAKTSSMNATRWQGLYKMVNRNGRLKKWLALALTGTEGEDMEADEQVCDGNDKEVI